MKHDILHQQLIRTTNDREVVTTHNLPGLYEALAADEVVGFPALRPHQRLAWHAFLAQLGTMAVHRAGLAEPPADAGTWLEILEALTAEHPDHEPWHLIVEDPAKPAFMQPPPHELADEYRKFVPTPDGIDYLVASKNHDLKQNIAIHAAPDDWIFALVSVQTASGFNGSGRYGSVRMNTGFGSRAPVGLVPEGCAAGGRVFHDMTQMLAHRETNRVRGNPKRRRSGGLMLLWLEPLDGASQHKLDDLDPYFIEAARRIRLRAGADGTTSAAQANRKSASVDAKANLGNVGDHWTPIAKPDGKAFSVPAGGWKYRSLIRLIGNDSEIELPASMLLKNTGAVKRWRLVARGTAKTQGGTEGYHEREDITLDARVVSMLTSERTRLRVHQTAVALDNAVTKTRARVRLALATAAASGKSGNDLQSQHWTAATRASAPFETAMEREFFPMLEALLLGPAPPPETPPVIPDDVFTTIDAIAEPVVATGIDRLAPSGWRRDKAKANALRSWRRRPRPDTVAARDGTQEKAADSERAAAAAGGPADNGDAAAETGKSKTGTENRIDAAAKRLQRGIQNLRGTELAAVNRIRLGGAERDARLIDGHPVIAKLIKEHGDDLPTAEPAAWAALAQAMAAGCRHAAKQDRRAAAGRPLGAALQLARISERTFNQLIRSRGERRLVETVRACRRMRAMKTPPPAAGDLCRFMLTEDAATDARIGETYYSELKA